MGKDSYTLDTRNTTDRFEILLRKLRNDFVITSADHRVAYFR